MRYMRYYYVGQCVKVVRDHPCHLCTRPSISLRVLYFDQETNTCLEVTQNLKFLEYYTTVWMDAGIGRPTVWWELCNCHLQILSHALAQLCARNECHFKGTPGKCRIASITSVEALTFLNGITIFHCD